MNTSSNVYTLSTISDQFNNLLSSSKDQFGIESTQSYDTKVVVIQEAIPFYESNHHLTWLQGRETITDSHWSAKATQSHKDAVAKTSGVLTCRYKSLSTHKLTESVELGHVLIR